jgi:DNA polymerase I
MRITEFREVVLVDFEFTAIPGERQVPLCCVAFELRSGRKFRIWQNEFGSAPPYATGSDVLFVAYYASAELGCYRAIGWSMPPRVLDLYVEFRNHTNGRRRPAGSGLLGALAYFGLDTNPGIEKEDLQKAIGSDVWQSRYTPAEIFDYCERDVLALQRLLLAMSPHIDLPRALLRGRYMAAASAMQYAGIPIDVETLLRTRGSWTDIQDELIKAVDRDYGVFEGRTFKRERWASWCVNQNIPWPQLATGQIDLSDETFRQMAKAYPRVAPMRELRSSLSELRLNDLAVGRDGRNRTVLWAFQSRTGRNQPSNSKYIFGPSVWLRGLIKPPPGHGIAYIDWKQQEFGIAAALSGDPLMQQAYWSGDPYLAFAKQAGAVPQDATKETHGPQRELFKQCVLAVQYGMQEQGLAAKIAQPPIVARDLLRAHRQTYQVFWRWSDTVLDTAILTGSLHTVFGWYIHADDKPNPRSFRNFPMQANGLNSYALPVALPPSVVSKFVRQYMTPF